MKKSTLVFWEYDTVGIIMIIKMMNPHPVKIFLINLYFGEKF